jgi:hypothetical protein
MRSRSRPTPAGALSLAAYRHRSGVHARRPVAFAERLVAEGAQIQLLKQPVRQEDLDGMRWVAERSLPPDFADESRRTP